MTSQAYSVPFKLLTAAITLGSIAWFFVMAWQGQFGSNQSVGVSWFAAASALMGWTFLSVLRSKTTLTAQYLHQSWIWDKQMDLRELAYAKLIRLPGLNWLVAPRLYVRSLDGKFAVFYAAEAPMIAQFEKIAAQLAV